MLYRCVTVFICLASAVGTQRAFADDIPMPPRCGMYSIQKVSGDGRLVSIAVATPTMFENGKKIPDKTRFIADVFQSTDQGKSYSLLLETVEGGSMLSKSNQPERLDTKVALRQPVAKDEVVFLAIRIRIGDQESRMVEEFMSFRNGDDIERFRSPADAVAALAGKTKPADSIPRFRPSPQQGELIKQLGQPDFFEIAYLRFEDENGKQICDRLERWFYLSNRTEFSFFNGQVTATSEFEGAPQVQTVPLYGPSQFLDSTSVSNVRTIAVEGKLKELDLEKVGLKSRLFNGVEMFFAKGLIVGFKDEELTYVRSMPNWLSQISLDSTQELSQRVQPPSWRHGSGLLQLGLQHRTNDSSELQIRVMPQTTSPTDSLGLGGLSPSILPTAYLGLPAGKPIGVPILPADAPTIRKFPFLVALSVIVAVGSLGYGICGLAGDIEKIEKAGGETVNIYTRMGEIIELFDKQNSAILESGNLSPAEQQRIAGKYEEARQALSDARDELGNAQGALWVEAVQLGLASSIALGFSITAPGSTPIKEIISSALGDGLTYYSDGRPAQLTKAQFDRAVDNAKSRINQFERNRYHQDQVKDQILAQWAVWDHQVSKNKISNEERKQHFYDFIDQLERDGWHVPQGIEKYAIDIVKTMTGVDPGDVPEQREPDEVIGIVATGKLNEETVGAIQDLIKEIAEVFKGGEGAPTLDKIEIVSKITTLTISPDRRASISPAVVNITLTDSAGKVLTLSISLSFSDAYDEHLELTGAPVEGERIPVKKVQGIGRMHADEASDLKQPFNWTAEYAGDAKWTLTVKITPSKRIKREYAEKFLLVFELEEVRK